MKKSDYEIPHLYDHRIKEYLVFTLEWPEATMPLWMRGIVEEECYNYNRIAPPKKMVIKYPDPPAGFDFRNQSIGYTVHSDDPSRGEICVAYLDSRIDMYDEITTLLHEIAHWLVKHFSNYDGGHTPEFYREYLRLTMKYGLDPNEVLTEAYESALATYDIPENVFAGADNFNIVYNLGSGEVK